MLIRAAVVRAHEQPFVIEDVELDDPRPHEAVVRLISFGLYHTDLVTRDGYYTIPLPCVLGHEGAGIVETGAGAVFTSLDCPAGSSLAVFGAGAVGMCAIMAARVVGCTAIIAVDLKPNRPQLASELGGTHTGNAAEEDRVEAIQQLTNGGVHYSFESTGVAPVIRQAVDAAWLGRFGRETKSP